MDAETGCGVHGFFFSYLAGGESGFDLLCIWREVFAGIQTPWEA